MVTPLYIIRKAAHKITLVLPRRILSTPQSDKWANFRQCFSEFSAVEKMFWAGSIFGAFAKLSTAILPGLELLSFLLCQHSSVNIRSLKVLLNYSLFLCVIFKLDCNFELLTWTVAGLVNQDLSKKRIFEMCLANFYPGFLSKGQKLEACHG